MNKSYSGVRHNPKPSTARGERKARVRKLMTPEKHAVAVRSWISGELREARLNA